MSMATLHMVHRATVLRHARTSSGGMPTVNWTPVKQPESAVDKLGRLRCYLDLSLIRAGKDPSWSPEVGRPPDRQGVFMYLPTADIRPGDHVQMLLGVGVDGFFQIEGSIERILKLGGIQDHCEVGVQEVAQKILIPD